MNSMIDASRLYVAALCGVALLAGCNAVEDVRSDPSTQLPKQLVVLEGKVYGLGIRRSIVVRNGTTASAASVLVQGFPGEAIGARGRESQFAFGALPDGTAYNIVVPTGLVPYGKICVVNNGTGTLHYNASDPSKGAPQNIEVVCTNDPAVARYDIRVATPAAFRDAPGAKVRLMTEEGIYESNPKDTADGDPNFVWFRKALITVPASGVLPFQNIVTATTEEGSTAALKLVNRCAVANHTRPSPAASIGADVTDISVGACKFSVGGSTVGTTETGGAVRYSRPVGVAADPAMGTGGLVLELKYANGAPIASAGGPTTEVTVTSFGSNFAFTTLVTSGAECPEQLSSTPVPCEVRGFYQVVVKQQPAGQKCMVTSSTVGSTSPLLGLNDLSTPVSATNNTNANYAASANLYILDESVGKGTFPINPADFTGLRVYCRALPAANRVLKGIYQLKNITTYASGVITGAFPWSPAYAGRREFSHMLTLFDDGTFLFGAHTAGDAFNSTSVANHVEYGFYEYAPGTVVDANNAVAGNKLRFTIHVDANTGAATGPLAAGLSAAEGPRSIGTGAAAVRHQVLTGLVLGTVPGSTRRTLTGLSGPDASTATTASRLLEFEEQVSTAGQMTGTWIPQDHLGAWTFNADTTWGYHAGVEGGYANIQNNCFKMDDFTVPSGQYVVTSGANLTYCAPVGQVFNSLQGSVAHSPVPLLQARLPGWRGWMAGSELGGASTARSPSPVYFRIAPASTFAATADPAIFPASSIGSTTWCPSEILGVRATENGALDADIRPMYFCRYNY
jgi:hypothetical protein